MKIKVLDSIPPDRIYFIPEHLYCPKCQAKLGETLAVLVLIQDVKKCPMCSQPLTINDFARSFAYIGE